MSDRDDDENEGWQTVGALRAAADAALRAAADAEAEAGDEARREATHLRAENTRLRDALDGIVEDLSRPVPPGAVGVARAEARAGRAESRAAGGG